MRTIIQSIMAIRSREWLMLAAALCICSHAARVRAAELQWRGRPYEIVANGRALPDFLRELAASQGTTAIVDPKVTGSISGRFAGTPTQTLDSVCSTYGLTWYYDGSYLYIERAADTQTQMTRIPPGSASRLTQLLDSMQVPDKRFALNISDRDNTVYASGPPRYVELVREAADSITNGGGSAEGATIRVFPLRYNWAADVTINRSGKDVVIPGVATILRQLFGIQPQAANPLANAMRLGGPTREVKLSSGDTINVPRIEIPLAGDMGSSSSISGTPGVIGYGASGGAAPGLGMSANAPFGAEGSRQLPQIVPDPSINAVLVRDLPENMSRYGPLIQQLDARPRLVEINLTIMDINLNSLDQLGIDWRLHTSHGDFQFGNGANPPLTFSVGSTESGQTGSTTPNGLALTASIGGSLRDYLLARINALAQTGDAKLYSKPKVLTMDNSEAVLENLTEFYVQVAGFQDASLYGVTTGQSVRVTPMIIDDDNVQRVMMSLDIQDGEVTSQTVSNVPVIQQRNIVTKTMIDEGRSLLIAGFNDDELNISKTGIPFLSDIPLIGNLFKYRTNTGTHMERFYLITPRVVTPAAVYASDGTAENYTSPLMENVVTPPDNTALIKAAKPLMPPQSAPPPQPVNGAGAGVAPGVPVTTPAVPSAPLAPAAGSPQSAMPGTSSVPAASSYPATPAVPPAYAAPAAPTTVPTAPAAVPMTPAAPASGPGDHGGQQQ